MSLNIENLINVAISKSLSILKRLNALPCANGYAQNSIKDDAYFFYPILRSKTFAVAFTSSSELPLKINPHNKEKPK
jgi:hypothetical protein